MAGRNDGIPRVAYLSPTWPDRGAANGIVTYTTLIRSGMRDAGAPLPLVMSPAVAAGHEDEGVASVVIPRLPLPVRLAAYAIERVRPGAWKAREFAAALDRCAAGLAAEHGVRIVEIEESFGYCGWMKRAGGVKVVVRLHGPWCVNGAWETPSAASSLRVRREGAGLRAADGVTSPSRDVLERTKRHYGLALESSAVIPNPVRVAAPDARWSPDACERSAIAFIGRFELLKGGDVMLDAYARVRRARPDARLLFVGPRERLTDKAGRMWSFNEYAAHALRGVEPAGLEAPGRIAPEQVAPYRRRAMVTVVASRQENFPYSVTEAMAQGCPIVATAVGGIPEIIEDGRNGLLARPEDPEDLSRAILAILDDPELGERLGRQALADCAERYDPAVIARQTIEFYRSVLEDR